LRVGGWQATRLVSLVGHRKPIVLARESGEFFDSRNPRKQ
jgi:hypothetical protein